MPGWSIGLGRCFSRHQKRGEAQDLAISLHRKSKKAMVIVQAFVDRIEDLFERSRLPPVEVLRPRSCPLCGQLAFVPEKRFGIVGHGTYSRQVLGVVEAGREAVTVVRRYLCRGCGHTINVLSDHLHPGRWYAAGAILKALKLHLLEGVSEGEIRRRFGVVLDSESWRSLRRWRSELLVTLWYWLSRRLGFQKEAVTRSEGRRRLRQLFSEAAIEKVPDADTVARSLLRSTVHFRGLSWPLGRDPPEKLAAENPR